MNPTSTPSLTEFDPDIIPYQGKAIRDIRGAFDYSQGTHEVLLSGSVGCLREDALVQTASGVTPISDIVRGKLVLSYLAKSNQFVFVPSSGAFPKGKDYLYRVIGEHGEYVASGNHLLATSPNTYCKISDLLDCEGLVLPSVRVHSHHESSRLLLREGVLHCSEILLSFLGHCAKHIRQCDQQLLLDLKTVLEFFPSQDDAQEFGLSFCLNRFLRQDDQSERGLKRDRNAEESFLRSMRDFSDLLAGQLLPVEGVCFQGDLKPCLHNLFGILKQMLFLMHTAHPQEIRLGLAFLLPALVDLLGFEVSYTNSTIVKIERMAKEDWYWDIQVPNTHNYIANGYQHHNSAKSILMAHIAVTHCLFNPGARFLIGRLSMPALRATLLQKIMEHIAQDLKEGYDFTTNLTAASIRFRNGSEIISRSWADKKYYKVRSLELSGAAIEETTENETQDFYNEIKMRVGRLAHVKEKIIIHATNPGPPSHWLYPYFIESKSRTRHVYYSVTTDNPFLPIEYIDQLKIDLDPALARRMIYGEWLEIEKEVIYYAYSKSNNFRDCDYVVDAREPIHISWDFNIGEGKPLSVVLFQFVQDTIHIFGEVVVAGMRTEDSCEELLGLGHLAHKTSYIIHGDASGKHKDTRSRRSDYDIIQRFFENLEKKVPFQMQLLAANPPQRTRHNLVNAYCENSLGQHRLIVYRAAPTADKGLRLTQLKKGGQYIEDDSKPFQHISTAIGYGLHATITYGKMKNQGTIRF